MGQIDESLARLQAQGNRRVSFVARAKANHLHDDRRASFAYWAILIPLWLTFSASLAAQISFL